MAVPDGHIRDYHGAPQGGGGEGPKVGKVDYSQLASIGSEAPASSGPATPVGERVGSIYPPGHRGADKHLKDFFEQEYESE